MQGGQLEQADAVVGDDGGGGRLCQLLSQLLDLRLQLLGCRLARVGGLRLGRSRLVPARCPDRAHGWYPKRHN